MGNPRWTYGALGLGKSSIKPGDLFWHPKIQHHGQLDSIYYIILYYITLHYYIVLYICIHICNWGLSHLCVDHNYEMILTRYVCLKMGYTKNHAIPKKTCGLKHVKTLFSYEKVALKMDEIGVLHVDPAFPDTCQLGPAPSKPHTWATRGRAFYFYLEASPGHREWHPPRCLFDTSLGWFFGKICGWTHRCFFQGFTVMCSDTWVVGAGSTRQTLGFKDEGSRDVKP